MASNIALLGSSILVQQLIENNKEKLKQFYHNPRVGGSSPSSATIPLRHSDYAAMAIALGAHGERVEDISQLNSAISRAIENAPAVVDVVTSQQVVSSDAKKGLGFVPDYQALTAWDDAEQARRQ